MTMGLTSMMIDDETRNVSRPIPIITATALRSPAPSQRTQEPMPESAIKRVDLAVASGVLSAAYGTPIGKMRLRHELSAGAYGACLWYREKRADYEAAMEMKGAKTGALEPRSKAEPPDVDSERGRRLAKRDRIARREYDAAKLAALACGRIKLLAFEAAVIFDREPMGLERGYVAQVAEALMRHRQLASRNRQGRRA